VVGAGAAGRPQAAERRGTSAGAITAALIAAGYTSAELKKIIFDLDFRRFEDKGWADRIPGVGIPLSILVEEGVFKGDEFLGWIRGLLADKACT
jgi:NTE family protein